MFLGLRSDIVRRFWSLRAEVTYITRMIAIFATTGILRNYRKEQEILDFN